MKINKLYPPKNNSYVIDKLPVSSMTLFGALANCYVTLYGKKEFDKFLSYFDQGKISSIFPALNIDEKEIIFFPKPFITKYKDDEDRDVSADKKKMKNIHWYSLNYLKKMGTNIIKQSNQFYHNIKYENSKLVGKEFIVSCDELDTEIIKVLEDISFINKVSNIKVKISRLNTDSTPFEQSELSFIDKFVEISNDKRINVKMFLYFIEDIKNDDRWEATKNLFIEEGIGGKRNLGKGWFKNISSEKFDFGHNKESEVQLLLSKLFPKKSEISKIVAYDIGKDDGYITFGYGTKTKKDSIFYIKEGSIVSSKIIGKIVQQEYKENNIYRYGKAFLFPLGGK